MAPWTRVRFLPQHLELHPARRDIHGAQRVEIESSGRRPTVRDQIDFQEPGCGVIPLGKRLNGDLVLQPRARSGGIGAPPLPLGARGRQEPLQCGEARLLY